MSWENADSYPLLKTIGELQYDLTTVGILLLGVAVLILGYRWLKASFF